MVKKSTGPHLVDEDVEQNIGEELTDPWLDPNQKDWPQNEEEDI